MSNASSSIALSGAGPARIELTARQLVVRSPKALERDATIDRDNVRALLLDRGQGPGRFPIDTTGLSPATVHDRPWEQRYRDDSGVLWLYPHHPPTAIPVVNSSSKLEPNLLVLFAQRMALPAAAASDGFIGGIVQALRMFNDRRGPSRHRPVQGVFCAVDDLDGAATALAGWPLVERVPYDVIEPPPPLPDDPEESKSLI